VSTAREDVLSRVKAANAAAGHPNPVPIPRDYHRSGTLAAGSRELLELLVDRLVDYKATVVESAPDGIPSAIAQALTDAGVTGPVLVPPGLPQGWCPDGVVDVTLNLAKLDARHIEGRLQEIRELMGQVPAEEQIALQREQMELRVELGKLLPQRSPRGKRKG
jgi:hypothetical protein